MKTKCEVDKTDKSIHVAVQKITIGKLHKVFLDAQTKIKISASFVADEIEISETTSYTPEGNSFGEQMNQARETQFAHSASTQVLPN